MAIFWEPIIYVFRAWTNAVETVSFLLGNSGSYLIFILWKQQQLASS